MKPEDPPLHTVPAAGSYGTGSANAWRLVLVALLVAVSYLALSPKPPPGIDLGWDKLNHMAAFAALAFCACRSFRASRRKRWVAACGLLVYGGLIEVLQLAVPGRSSAWGDLLADAIGIVCGMAIARALWWWGSTRPRD
jgi:VanZ family protein